MSQARLKSVPEPVDELVLKSVSQSAPELVPKSVSQSVSQSAPDTAPAFGVYLHWPFCASKCPYCDFNSHVREAIDTTAWQKALCAELEDSATSFWTKDPQGTPLAAASVFFGGGTPSLMPPDSVAAVIEKVQFLWPHKGRVEITLECNPSDLDEAHCRALRDAGVNRLSIGVQSFDDAVLAFLGRRHDAAQARAALTAAVKTFDRVSLDLIYAHPEQTRAAWREDLAQGLSFATEHLSAYQLTLEPNTPFYSQARRGDFALPVEATALALWNETQEATTKAGLIRYETSNHARGGVAGAADHNLQIWRGGDYAAIGPGAHGRATLNQSPPQNKTSRATIQNDAHGRATLNESPPQNETSRATIENDAHGRATLNESPPQNETSRATIKNDAHGRATLNQSPLQDEKSWASPEDTNRLALSRIAAPERWLHLRSQGKDTWREKQLLTKDQQRDELFLSGLRLSAGITLNRLTRETGYPNFHQALPAPDRLDSLLQNHLLVLDESGLRATETGAVRLNALLDHLLAVPAVQQVAEA